MRSLLDLANGAEDGAHVFHGHAVLHHLRHAKYVPAFIAAGPVRAEDVVAEFSRRHALALMDVYAGVEAEAVPVLRAGRSEVVSGLGLEGLEDVHPIFS